VLRGRAAPYSEGLDVVKRGAIRGAYKPLSRGRVDVIPYPHCHER